MKKILKFIGKYKIFLVLSVLLATVSVILQLYVPILFGDAIDQIVAEHQVHFDAMWVLLREILVLVAISALATWIMNMINNHMTYHIVQDIRSQAIRHIQRLPLSYLDRHSSGDIVSRIIADTDILSDGILLGFTQLFSGIVTIVVTLIFMFSKNFWITLLVIVLTPMSFLIARFISSRSFEMFHKQSETRGNQTALIDEMIGNQKVVKAFGYEEKASERFAQINADLQKYSQKAVFYSSLTNPSTRFVNNVIYAGVALVGAFMIPGGALTVGGLSVLLSYANQYMKPFNDISSVITEMQNALACANRIFDLLEEEEESPDVEGTINEVKGNVSISHVDFSYDKNHSLIEDFNLEVEPGMRIAIVGPTGCGKTTFLNSLTKLYQPTKGEILINGEVVDLKKHNIAYIFQEYSTMPWLTVEENVRFGLDIKHIDRSISDKKVEEYLDIVGLTKYRKYYPDQLSASMLQRVVIARAFATEPEVLLMDEPYGQLDIDLRFKLEDELLHLWQRNKTTVIFITHNIEEAVYLGERILVLTNKPTSIKQEIINDLPRPRDIASPDFIQLRNEVTDLIKWW